MIHELVCIFGCLVESVPVSVSLKYCSSPSYHLTNIKDQQRQHIRQDQATEETHGHWCLVVCWSFLFPVSQNVFTKVNPFQSLCWLQGKYGLCFLSLSVKTQVWGRISKNCVFLWNQEHWDQHPGLPKPSNLRLTSTLQLLTNDLT